MAEILHPWLTIYVKPSLIRPTDGQKDGQTIDDNQDYSSTFTNQVMQR